MASWNRGSILAQNVGEPVTGLGIGLSGAGQGLQGPASLVTGQIMQETGAEIGNGAELGDDQVITLRHPQADKPHPWGAIRRRRPPE